MLNLSVAATDPAPERPRKVLFSAMKNEGPFVLEWIAYHKAIGFDEIVICSNPSNDGMAEVLDALADAGEIRHLRRMVAKGQSPQIVASSAFTTEIGYETGNWHMWLDADEFLNIHVGDGSLDALISAMGDRQCALINWRVFGAGGHQSFPGRFIADAFVGAASQDFSAHLEQKSLFRFSPAVRSYGVTGISRPLLARSPGLAASDIVVGNGQTANPASSKHRRWLRGDDTKATARVSPEEVGWALAQINHYMVRTPEFFALKKLRGRGYKPDAVGETNSRHTEAFFHLNDRNEAEDRTILRWQDAVTKGIVRLMALPGVAQAKAQSDGMVRGLLNGMAGEPVSAEGSCDESAPLAPGPDSADQHDSATLTVGFHSVATADDVAVEQTASVAMTFPRKERAFVLKHYATATSILEYGSGGSTVLAARLGKRVISVESDRVWAARMSDSLAAFAGGATVVHVDIGPTGTAGVPSRPRFHRRFHTYPLSVWDRPDLGDPDLVLINGRFRAACLVAVLLRAKRPTTVLFDEYEDRPYYHRVERLAKLEEMVGRMACFTVTPGAIPPDMLTEVVGWFADLR